MEKVIKINLKSGHFFMLQEIKVKKWLKILAKICLNCFLTKIKDLWAG